MSKCRDSEYNTADAHINHSAVTYSLHYQQKLSVQVQCKLFMLVLHGY